MNENTIKTKSFQFAIRIVHLYKYLCDEKREYVLSKQILRSGTSIGANVRESQNAESKADFIHKLGIAQKETDETLYWLELLEATSYLDEEAFLSMHKDANEILKLVRSIIITSKKNKD
ncbi:four helix bundle protein [Ancylomarina euxinus]|uniref:Four helix bundle protein n=1 Tax=Ancylomarina euxinus TaxID=2283627 RepID=A0A425Y0F1_9BACT|nr:four helix bundle protein [Ancylomarina euxinus]MCZ4695301.1 four helix bundle protein [Ancylomarina euxinus]MUP15496.1 four helix bundle protein [Ancylomarina euxinus]RRG21203.1 four helix bundle protein [Ancylomarina euxinus]